jgi:hypothetical protein
MAGAGAHAVRKRGLRALMLPDRDALVFRPRLEDVRRNGSPPFTPAAFVNSCRHAQEFVPVAQEDGTCQLVPIIVEAL